MNLTRTLLLVLTLVAVGLLQLTFGTAAMSSPEDRPAKKEKEIVECRVAIDPEIEGVSLELRITDQKRIKKLIQDPLTKARKDPKPARYEILGPLYIKYKDGSTASAMLFLPWGRYTTDDKYMIADLAELKKEFKAVVSFARRRLETK
jgi:hypothetical protein